MHELVERARHGDHDAFTALVGLTIDRMNATAWLIARDRTIAEDAVQEACLRAWRDLPSLRDPARYEAWLRRLLVRACFDLLRRHRRSAVAPAHERDPGPLVGDASNEVVLHDALERAFRRLSPEHRAAGAVAGVLLVGAILAGWWRSPPPIGPSPSSEPSASAAATASAAPSAAAVQSPEIDNPVMGSVAIPNADPAEFGGAWPHDVVVGGPGLVAVGSASPCCADASYDDEPWSAMIWTSPDGRRWELLPDLDTFGRAGLRAVAATDDGLMVAAGYEVLPPDPSAPEHLFRMEARLWRSTNGTDWISVSAPDGEVQDIEWSPLGWVAVGAVGDDAAVSISSDLETWTTEFFGPGAFDHVAVDANGVIVAGGCLGDLATAPDGCGHRVATSTDARTWAEAELDGSVTAIVGMLEGGFAVVGAAGGRAASWGSPDGVTWDGGSFPDSAPDGFTAAAVGQSGVIAAEAASDATGGPRVWHSFDGRQWTLIAELEPIPDQRDTKVLTLAFRDAQYVVLGNGFRDGGEPSAWHGP